ncbi:hypothetical protein ACFV4G_35200 [Kitasatospora sp. NPDC059747]|uniref:hypothetical protein n=1 Tax=Kitasatospora sp. NPDC059747 TaxID=3346930 RepID=UPI003656C297
MAGQYPGTFGPPPGAAAQPPGRPSASVRVLCALVPLLTAGVFGPLPSLVLAIRRRRPYDIAGAVVYCLLLLTMVVCAGVASDTKASAANVIGEIALALLWLTPTLHYLVMDRRSLWAPAPYAPSPAAPYGATTPGHTAPSPAAPYGATTPGHTAPSPAAPYGATTPGHTAPSPAAPYGATTPGHTAPSPAAPYGATTPGHTAPPPADDLRELGELLRRQAREGRS